MKTFSKRLDNSILKKAIITLTLAFTFFVAPIFTQTVNAEENYSCLFQYHSPNYDMDVLQLTDNYIFASGDFSVYKVLYSYDDYSSESIFFLSASPSEYVSKGRYPAGGKIPSNYSPAFMYFDFPSSPQYVSLFSYQGVYYFTCGEITSKSGHYVFLSGAEPSLTLNITSEIPSNQILSYVVCYYYKYGKLPDGVEGYVDIPEPDVPEDSDIWIENLQAYEKSDGFFAGIGTNITWDSLNLYDFPDISGVTVEAKVDFSSQPKQGSTPTKYTDVPLFEGIPDADGKYHYNNSDFYDSYLEGKGISTNMLRYNTDKIYCRYKYTKTVDGKSTVCYTPWQGTGESHNGANNPSFDENIDISNLRFVYTNNDPDLTPSEEYHYKFMWDKKESYDENTYMVITADIKWKPTPGKLNSVTNVPYIVRGDLLASDGEIEFSVSDAWKKYFAKEGIDYSVFSTQWVENFYFQVFKKVDGEWKNSNKVRFNVPTQSSGQGSLNDYTFKTETGKFDEFTGEWISGSYDKNGNFIPEKDGGNANHHYGNGGTGEITDKDPTNPDDWGIPEGVTIPEYISNLAKNFLDSMGTLFKSVGQVPAMIGSLFPFLPGWLVTALFGGIIIAIILRIFGR